MTSRTEYSQEWRRAEDVLARSMGFRVKRVEGDPKFNQRDAFQVVTFDIDAKGKEVTRGVRPTEKATWDAWCEAVRFRIDHDAACKLAWDLYAAATGQTIESFNGMPSGTPVEHVRQERQRMLPLYEAAQRVAASDGSYTTEIAGVVISKANGGEGIEGAAHSA